MITKCTHQSIRPLFKPETFSQSNVSTFRYSVTKLQFKSSKVWSVSCPVWHTQVQSSNVYLSTCSAAKATANTQKFIGRSSPKPAEGYTKWPHTFTAHLVRLLPDRTKGLNKEQEKTSCTIGFIKLYIVAIVFLYNQDIKV